MICYVDESIRSREKLYMIAASVVVAADAQDVLDELRRAAPGRSKRFHWRIELEKIRLRMLDMIRDLHLHTLAVVYVSKREKWAGRGRVQALKGLLWELQNQESKVFELVIETRGKFGDEENRKTIFHAQQAGIADRELIYRFDSPTNPFLWVPDAIAGAVGSFLVDGNGRYLERLDHARPHIIEVSE
ncbi:MAG: hypothetical protein ACREP9_10045 [Candidatus Dormibacteraceae bacterium]